MKYRSRDSDGPEDIITSTGEVEGAGPIQSQAVGKGTTRTGGGDEGCDVDASGPGESTVTYDGPIPGSAWGEGHCSSDVVNASCIG